MKAFKLKTTGSGAQRLCQDLRATEDPGLFKCIDDTPMVSRIWLRCSWRPMAFGSLEVLTKQILEPTASKIWGPGQLWVGFVCFKIGVSARG